MPEWFHGVAANKEKDVGAFLEGTAGVPARAEAEEGIEPGTMKIEPDAAGMNEVRLERITEHFSTTYVEPGKIAGCQIAVVRGGHVAYHRSLGLMDREAAEARWPMTPSSASTP